ncbi:MAG: glycosyltransferase [Akkermansiaceae bacterium]|nr:glycosyltransferase [Akkermansiaceae bacterium]NNM31393.1 glycosyltransferase [Akkermansiaceae bacterium]
MEFLSLVVPVCDHPEHLDALYDELARRAGDLAKRWEIIFVDYGTDSRQWLATRKLQERGASGIRSYRLVNQRSRHEALRFGCRSARGEVVMNVSLSPADGAPSSPPRVRLRRIDPRLSRTPEAKRTWVPCGGAPNLLYLPGTTSRPAA